MAPRLVVCQYRTKIDNIHYNMMIKKLNRSLRTIAQLRKRNNLLYFQNKELSNARNCLLLQKLELERENINTKNSNIQLNSVHHAVTNKLGTIEKTLQTCVPALVTLSQCIPSMLNSVHELSKIEKINENVITKDKTKRLTRTVKPMVRGLSISQPVVNISRIDCMMSPIIESPCSEPQTPRVQRTSCSRNSPSSKGNLEPYVRLKDVAVMLRNTKSVSSEHSTRQSDNLGEGPSWLHDAGQIENGKDSENTVMITENDETSFRVPDKNIENSLVVNVPHDISTSVSNSVVSVDNTPYKTEEHYSELISTPESSMLRNITSRKRRIRRSSESSSISDIDDSRSSQRSSKRSTTKKVNYKEPSLHDKLRRN